MTTDCLDTPASTGARRLHDVILAVAVAVILVIPAALSLGALI